MNELISKNITAVQLFSEDGLEPVLAKIKIEIDKFVPDVETSKGRKEIASFARKIASSKVFIEAAGKELVSGIKARAKLIDTERRRSREILDQWRDEVRLPLTNYENAEKARVELERQQEIFLMDWDEALGIDDLFNREKAMEAKEAEMERVEQERRDKEEAERLAKEQAEREERIKKEAAMEAERKLAQAKIDAIAAKEKDERDRIALEERMKVEKEQAKLAKIEAARLAEIDKQKAVELATRQAEERARLAKVEQAHREAVEKAEADKKAANKKHRAAVNNKIVDALNHILKIHPADAKKIIVAIAQGNIPNVTINY